jgi:hypothetical protein
MEKHLETSTKLLPLLKKKFEECQDSLTVVMTDWDKHRAQLVHLGEKVIQMDNWQEDRFMQMMMQLQQELERRRRPWKASSNCPRAPRSKETFHFHCRCQHHDLRPPW